MPDANATGEPDVPGLFTVAHAIAILDAAAVSPRVERVTLDAARGRRLASDVLADRPYPPFEKSLMDGFAVRAADVTVGGSTTLKLVGEVAAGAWADRPLSAGEAMQVMTGAPLPAGADGVVPVEHGANASGNAVELSPTGDPRRFVAHAGSDATSGRVVVGAGTLIGSAHVAALATVGAAMLGVFAKPRVAILATGDEIVPIDATPGRGQIRNSNVPMLAALLAAMGCDIVATDHVADDAAGIRAAVESKLNGRVDTLFVTGGMSMGAYDFVPGALEALGIDVRVRKLRMKPGKPFAFGVRGKQFVFGLPGNPVSAFVCTLRLAARVLGRLGGGDAEPAWLSAPLAETLPANGPREFYQPAKLVAGRLVPLQWKGSADVFTLAAADALLVRPENDGVRAAGEMIRALPIEK